MIEVSHKTTLSLAFLTHPVLWNHQAFRKLLLRKCECVFVFKLYCQQTQMKFFVSADNDMPKVFHFMASKDARYIQYCLCFIGLLYSEKLRTEKGSKDFGKLKTLFQ